MAEDYMNISDSELLELATKAAELLGMKIPSIPASRMRFLNAIDNTQVFQATHSTNNARLLHMDRSFISFSFGGRLIEDFNLLVQIESDRLSRQAYAEFKDNTTESDILDGQFFWSSHFNNNKLELSLATDGIEESMLEDFKHWFQPGIKRELVLSEHPNRGIMARVSATPQISMLPFERETTVRIGGRPYLTSTTVYKGDITLSFTMDDPHWYGISNIICYVDENNNIDYDKWLAANGVPIIVHEDPDVSKIVLEDGVPVNTMLKYADVMIGTNIVLDAEAVEKTKVGENEQDTARADIADNDNDYDSGRVGPLLKTSGGLALDAGVASYFYYPGSAPSKPILTFTLTPIVNDDGYIINPKNSFTNSGTPYNKIVIESTVAKEFTFTTPSIWTGYNQAIAILKQMNGQPLEDVRRTLREGVNHWAARAYAIAQVTGSGVESLQAADVIDNMKKFILDSNGNAAPATFMFNCQTGESVGSFSYRDKNNNILQAEENVGDMVRSNYLIIEERNYPSKDGYVEKWTEETPKYGHRLYHDVENGLTNLLLEYKYMYL